MRWVLFLTSLMLSCSSSPAPAPSVATTQQRAIGEEVESPAVAEDLDPAEDGVLVRLTAAAHDGGTWAYNGQIPGPTIRAKVGDTVTVELTNSLPNPTTIHWHGVDVPFDMDGVVWMGAPIPADGGTFTYSFQVDRAGTFWYHPHFDTEHQVDLGLYGMIVVDDPSEPATDRELLLVFDQAAEADRYDNGPMHRHGLVDLGTPWLVNGLEQPKVTLTPGERVRLRVLNASNTGYLDLSWPDMLHIASDQGLLPQVQTPDSVVLAPGDRAEFEVVAGDSPLEVTNRPYTLSGGAALGEPTALMTFEIEGSGGAPAPLVWPTDPTPPTADPGYADVVYVFSGSDEGDAWMINGEVFPDVTIEAFTIGDEVILEIRNLSPTEHPFHTHGHSFEVLSRDGVAPTYRTIEDTINIGIREIVRVRFVATNPGDWMTHCHILQHADGGMMTVLRVSP